MGIFECLLILVGSLIWGGLLFTFGKTLREALLHDGLGFFFQVIGLIFIIAPIAFVFCCICITIILSLGLVAKTIFSILI